MARRTTPQHGSRNRVAALHRSYKRLRHAPEERQFDPAYFGEIGNGEWGLLQDWDDHYYDEFCTCGICYRDYRDIPRVVLLLRDATEELFSIGARFGERPSPPAAPEAPPERSSSEPPGARNHEELVARLFERQSDEIWPRNYREDIRWGDRMVNSAIFAKSVEDRHPSHRALSRQAADWAIEFSAPFFDDPRRDDLVAFGFILLHFETFWVRPLEEWRPPAEGDAHASMLRHVFAIHPIPDCLLHGMSPPIYGMTKWIYWMILLGNGTSLKRAGQTLDWWVNESFVEHLHRLPTTVWGTRACTMAEILRLGGSEALAACVLENEFYIIDPTAPVRCRGLAHRARGTLAPALADDDADEDSFYNSEWMLEGRLFWQETMDWLVRHEVSLPPGEIAGVLEWAAHRQTDAMARAGERFRWKGRSLAAVLRAVGEYRRELELAAQSGERWEPMGWAWEWADASGTVWEAIELTTAGALAAEGAALRHCVGTYAWSAKAGYCAIVSLRRDGGRCLTIEVELPSRRTVQICGMCNRPPTVKERAVVRRWHAEAVTESRASETETGPPVE